MIYPAAGITPEGGFFIRMLNQTGETSVRGTVVSAYGTSTKGAAKSAANEDMAVGTVYDAGIAQGSPMRVTVAGVAYVLLRDTQSATRGYVLYCSATAGRADSANTAPATTTHFREIGHCLETVSSGTNVVCLAVLHFN